MKTIPEYLKKIFSPLAFFLFIALFTGCVGKHDNPPSDFFTVVLLPDTQHYTMDGNDKTYEKQIQWIIDNKGNEKVKFVIHLGDITQNNKTSEWNLARSAQSMLDHAKIPYSIMPGNHDYPNSGRKTRDTEIFNKYFGPQWFDLLENESWYGGHMGSTNDNNYTFFQHGDIKFMVISLEFAPSKDALCWANQIISKHKDRRTIIVTHCYQTIGGGHEGGCAENYDIIGSPGSVIWQELVKQNNNIFMVLSGHVNDSEYNPRKRNDPDSTIVHELLVDYQSEVRKAPDPPFGTTARIERLRIEGGIKYGNGWMRTLKFYPSTGTIQARTFTVLSSITKLGILKEEDGTPYDDLPSEPDHQFSFKYNMSSMPEYKFYSNNVSFNDMTVNSNADRQQKNPAIAMGKNGDFVVAWEDDSQGALGKYQIYARGFYPSGCEKFSDITVNIDSRGQQLNPSIAMAADGSFVVCWQDDRDNNNTYQIRAAMFDSVGRRKRMDFTVNSDANRDQLRPAIAMSPSGNFVISWEDDSHGAKGVYQIYARGFHADGTEKFHDITVNANSQGQQRKPAIAMADDGTFAVAWEDDQNNNGQYEILAAIFHADGTKKKADFTVNTDANRQQRTPSIAMNSLGAFVVAWEDDSKGENPANTNIYQIYARGFNADGSQNFGSMTVNTDANDQQLKPSVAIQNNGDFIVVWEDNSKGANNFYQIYARGFKSDGTEKFKDITINSDASGTQLKPCIAISAGGNYVVAWEDDVDDNGKFQIVARGLNYKK